MNDTALWAQRYMRGLFVPPETASSQYSVKYLGVLRGDVGIQSRRKPLPSATRSSANGTGEQLGAAKVADTTQRGPVRLAPEVFDHLPKYADITESPRPEVWDEWQLGNQFQERSKLFARRPGAHKLSTTSSERQSREAQFFMAGGVM